MTNVIKIQFEKHYFSDKINSTKNPIKLKKMTCLGVKLITRENYRSRNRIENKEDIKKMNHNEIEAFFKRINVTNRNNPFIVSSIFLH